MLGWLLRQTWFGEGGVVRKGRQIIMQIGCREQLGPCIPVCSKVSVGSPPKDKITFPSDPSLAHAVLPRRREAAPPGERRRCLPARSLRLTLMSGTYSYDNNLALVAEGRLTPTHLYIADSRTL
jgi:hypothetical protein